jgi:hypothetical protein
MLAGQFSVRTELAKYQIFKERLVADFPSADEETLRDTLQGITDLHEMIAAVIRSALVDEALREGLRSRLEDMRSRMTRLEERGLKKRQLALEAMTEAGLTKLEQPDFTASAREGTPSLLVTFETLIPQSYWLPQPAKLSRQALLSDLKRGLSVAGAQPSPKPIVSLATRLGTEELLAQTACGARPKVAPTAPFILQRSASQFGLEKSKSFERGRVAARQPQLQQGRPTSLL